jgi:hypothetical protein
MFAATDHGKVSEMPRAGVAGEMPQSLASLVSVGVLSYRALRTISRSLQAYRASGLMDWAGEFFVFFNAMTAEDQKLVQASGVNYFGSAENLGIYGGFRAIAEHAQKPYVLILENDIIPLPGSLVQDCVVKALSDMIEHGIKSFCLRSRENPGHGGIYPKYIRCFEVHDPIIAELKPSKPTLYSKLRMMAKHGNLDKFRAIAIYIERFPERVHGDAVRKLPSGNYLTDSRYRNWSNQAVLVDRQYFLDVICRRVEEHPDPRLLNGHQDIERALNVRWWRNRKDLTAHAADGVFTHSRLD